LPARGTHAILTKEIGWFDVNEPMEVNARVTIQDAIGSRMGNSLHYSTLLLSGVLIGLIMLATMPFIAVSTAVFMDVLAKATSHRLAANSRLQRGWTKGKRTTPDWHAHQLVHASRPVRRLNSLMSLHLWGPFRLVIRFVYPAATQVELQQGEFSVEGRAATPSP
jgi:hypothetical protein